MAKNQITIPVYIPHAGCTHRCTFCNQKAITGTASAMSSSRIEEYVDKILDRCPDTVTRTEIGFFGGSFTGIERSYQKELLDIAGTYLNRGLIDGIRISTRPDYINRDTLDFLKDFSVDTVELGIQSLSDKVLTASNRGHTVKDSHEAAILVKNYGLKLILQLMPGLPRDSENTSILTAQKAAELGPDAVRLYPAVIFKGTELEKLYRENTYTPLSLESAVSLCSKMYRIFTSRKIQVIRTGLHPLNVNEQEEIIAGPYHPTFGFLVKSRIKRDIMERELSLYLKDSRPNNTKNLLMLIPRTSTEEFIGNRKENIDYLKKRFRLESLNYKIVKSDDTRLKFTR